MPMKKNLLEVRNVTKIFSNRSKSKKVVALDDVSIKVPVGKALTIAIAGESGSGKTTLAQIILGFLKPTKGEIFYKDTDIYNMKKKTLINFRKEVQAVFQNPYEVFNPFYKIDHVFDITIKKFSLAENKSIISHMIEHSLKSVRLEPGQIIGRYPHQLSGGELQRVIIARALLLKPHFFIFDEPVSMIDASLRVIILDIIEELKSKFNIFELYITHDLATALQISDDIFILYKGTIIEGGNAQNVIQNPKHPYTQLLVSCVPRPDPEKKWGKFLNTAIEEDANQEVNNRCKFYLTLSK